MAGLSTICPVKASMPSEKDEDAPAAVTPPTETKADELASDTPLERPVSGALGRPLLHVAALHEVEPGCDE